MKIKNRINEEDDKNRDSLPVGRLTLLLSTEELPALWSAERLSFSRRNASVTSSKPQSMAGSANLPPRSSGCHP